MVTVVSFSMSTFSISHAEAGVTENTWASKAPMQVSRGDFGVAVVNGKIYAIGGVGSLQYLSTNEEYDPVTDTWTFKEPMPTPRAYFGIAVYQNRIYVIGGTAEWGANGLSPTGANVVYDPATDTWETKTPMPTPRIGVRANVVDGKIYLIGGKSNATEVYDPATDSWTTKADILTPRVMGSACVFDKRIYFMGGVKGDVHTHYKSHTQDDGEHRQAIFASAFILIVVIVVLNWAIQTFVEKQR